MTDEAHPTLVIDGAEIAALRSTLGRIRQALAVRVVGGRGRHTGHALLRQADGGLAGKERPAS